MYTCANVAVLTQKTCFCHPTGHCMANDQYIGQLKETFATSVPSRIAAFFGEPIQVQQFLLWRLRKVVLEI